LYAQSLRAVPRTSQRQTAYDAVAKIGKEHGAAGKVTSKVHDHTVLTVPTSRSVLEREIRQAEPDLDRIALIQLKVGLKVFTSVSF
jgi:hypothetical protein